MPEKSFCYPFGIIGNLCNFTKKNIDSRSWDTEKWKEKIKSKETFMHIH